MFVNFPATVKENYMDQEPYEDREPYQTQKVYTDYEDIEYKVLERKYSNHFWTSGVDVWVTIKNIDDVGGYFSVDFDVKTSRGDYKTTSNKYFLASGDSHKFLVSFKGDYKKSDYDINVPSKEVTKIKTITEWRTVTKYRPVEKIRDKIIYCTLFEKVRGECKNAKT